MAITYNQEIWSALVRKYLDKASVYKEALTNSNYEGEVKYGGKVHILGVGEISIEDHTGSWDDSDWGDLTDDDLEFTITRNRRFKFKVREEDQQGSAIKLADEGSLRAAYAIGQDTDAFLAGLHTQVDSGNLYGDDTTPKVIGFGTGEVDPVDGLGYLMEVLTNADANPQTPNVVIPVWWGTMLWQALGTRATQLGDGAITGGAVKQGLYLTNVAGFAGVYVSRNVKNTSSAKYKVLAGDKHITYASAIENVKVVDLQNDFALGVKGHYVNGAKLLQGELMALATVNKGAYKS